MLKDLIRVIWKIYWVKIISEKRKKISSVRLPHSLTLYQMLFHGKFKRSVKHVVVPLRMGNQVEFLILRYQCQSLKFFVLCRWICIFSVPHSHDGSIYQLIYFSFFFFLSFFFLHIIKFNESSQRLPKMFQGLQRNVE